MSDDGSDKQNKLWTSVESDIKSRVMSPLKSSLGNRCWYGLLEHLPQDQRSLLGTLIIDNPFDAIINAINAALKEDTMYDADE